MRKFKKLIVGVCTVACCLSAIVMPVSAESNGYYSAPGSYEYVLSSYTQPFNFSTSYSGDYIDENEHDRQLNALYDQCRVKDPNAWYIDTAIINEAKKAINAGKYVYDIRNLGNFGLFCLSKDGINIFNYGICITDTPILHAKSKEFICKCSKQDYDELFYHVRGRNRNGNEYDFIAITNYDTSEYSYNPQYNILRFYFDSYM